MGQVRHLFVTVEVRTVPGFLATADPETAVVDKGSTQELASFTVTVTPETGYDKPVWLDAVNIVGEGITWSVNPIPAGGGKSVLTVPIGGFPLGETEIGIDAMEDQPPA